MPRRRLEVAAEYLKIELSTQAHSDFLLRAFVDGRFEEVAEWVKADWEGIELRQNAYERAQSTEHPLTKIERGKAKKEVGEMAK